jgi:hypothetical protein
MRIVPLALALVSASGLGLFAACSVDDAGMEDGSADGAFDVTGDVVGSDAGAMDAPADTYVGPTCQTIDASCLGADIPDGWVLFNVAQDAGGCPGDDEDYEQHDLVTNPQLRSDSCTCAGCTTTGAWGCSGNVTVIGGTGGSCGNDASFASGPTCVPLSESTGLGCLFAASTTVSVLEPAPSGSPSCDAGFTGSLTAQTDSVVGCKPKQCTTDFCGAAAHGFQTCILHNGDPSGVCPTGFRPAFGPTNGTASAVGNVAVSCSGCSCQVSSAPAACTGSVRVFNGSSTCDGDGGTNGADYVETVDASAACQSLGQCAYTSLYYAPNEVPPTTCSPSVAGPVPGDAGLTNAVTICCGPTG